MSNTDEQVCPHPKAEPIGPEYPSAHFLGHRFCPDCLEVLPPSEPEEEEEGDE